MPSTATTGRYTPNEKCTAINYNLRVVNTGNCNKTHWKRDTRCCNLSEENLHDVSLLLNFIVIRILTWLAAYDNDRGENNYSGDHEKCD